MDQQLERRWELEYALPREYAEHTDPLRKAPTSYFQDSQAQPQADKEIYKGSTRNPANNAVQGRLPIGGTPSRASAVLEAARSVNNLTLQIPSYNEQKAEETFSVRRKGSKAVNTMQVPSIVLFENRS